MRIMNKNLAVVKALTEKGLSVDQLITNIKAQKDPDAAAPRKSIEISKLDTLDASALTDTDILEIMKGVSRDYKLKYEEDLYVPGKRS